MTESDLIAVKAHLQPSVRVINSRTIAKITESLESNLMVDTGSRVLTANEKYHGLTTLVLQQTEQNFISTSFRIFDSTQKLTKRRAVGLGALHIHGPDS